MIDRRPAVIARCERVPDDVAAAVDLARHPKPPLSVYCGGHAVTGHAVCEGGVMRWSTSHEPSQRSIPTRGPGTGPGRGGAVGRHRRRHPGARAGDDRRAELDDRRRRASPRQRVGLAGAEAEPHTCDSLRSVEIVIADGNTLTASESENADLFWGTRGGGEHFRSGHRVRVRAPGDRSHGSRRDADVSGPDGGRGAPSLPRFHCPGPGRGLRRLRADLRAARGVRSRAGPRPAGGGHGPLLRRAACRRIRRRASSRCASSAPPAVAWCSPCPMWRSSSSSILRTSPAGGRNYWTADFLAQLPDEAVENLSLRAPSHEALAAQPDPFCSPAAGRSHASRTGCDGLRPAARPLQHAHHFDCGSMPRTTT